LYGRTLVTGKDDNPKNKKQHNNNNTTEAAAADLLVSISLQYQQHESTTD
jgi:hypothetical protein